MIHQAQVCTFQAWCMKVVTTFTPNQINFIPPTPFYLPVMGKRPVPSSSSSPIKTLKEIAFSNIVR